MSSSQITWQTEQLPDRVLRVAFVGTGGIGSAGNEDGERMRDAIRGVLGAHAPMAIVIDLREFKYRFGDWIGGVTISALAALGIGRVCVLANGKTAEALHSLWAVAKLDLAIPRFEELADALAYLSGPRSGPVPNKPVEPPLAASEE